MQRFCVSLQLICKNIFGLSIFSLFICSASASAQVYKVAPNPCPAPAAAPSLGAMEGDVAPADLTPPFAPPGAVRIERGVPGTRPEGDVFLPLEYDLQTETVTLPDGRRLNAAAKTCGTLETAPAE
ncbi:MAG: hypothetical protein AAGC95_03655 [Pseudomonadota bacterium]